MAEKTRRKTDGRKNFDVHFRITDEEKRMLDYLCETKNITVSEELMGYVETEFRRINGLLSDRFCDRN